MREIDDDEKIVDKLTRDIYVKARPRGEGAN